MIEFELTSRAIDTEDWRRRMFDVTCGGYAAFEGWIRDHNEGHRVRRLEYDVYETLARSEGEKILREAVERFGVTGTACVHRFGCAREKMPRRLPIPFRPTRPGISPRSPARMDSSSCPGGGTSSRPDSWPASGPGDQASATSARRGASGLSPWSWAAQRSQFTQPESPLT